MAKGPTFISGPLSIGETFDRGVRLVRAHFTSLLTTSAAAFIPLGVIAALVAIFTASDASGLNPAPSFSGGPLGDFIGRIISLSDAAAQSQGSPWLSVISFTGSLVTMIVTLALFHQINALLHGDELSLGTSFERGTRRLFSYFGMLILEGLAFVPVVLIGALLALLFPILFVVVVPAILYLMVGWAITAPAFAIEELGPTAALGRSWGLTSGYRWRTLGFFVLISLLGGVITYVPLLTIYSIAAALLPPASVRFLTGLDVTLTLLISMLWLPISVACYLFYYYDLRVRKESYDLELRMQAVRPPPPPLGRGG